VKAIAPFFLFIAFPFGKWQVPLPREIIDRIERSTRGEVRPPGEKPCGQTPAQELTPEIWQGLKAEAASRLTVDVLFISAALLSL
jgi:hypothetical protein